MVHLHVVVKGKAANGGLDTRLDQAYQAEHQESHGREGGYQAPADDARRLVSGGDSLNSLGSSTGRSSTDVRAPSRRMTLNDHEERMMMMTRFVTGVRLWRVWRHGDGPDEGPATWKIFAKARPTKGSSPRT